jgi:tetratricopeptide (TPR) repeat protein
MKRDEVAEALGRTVEYSRSHIQMLLIAVGTLVVVVLAAVGAWLWRANAAARTNERLAEALEVYQAPVVTDDARPDDPEEPSFASEEARRQRAGELFEEVRGGSGGAADVALVYLGQIAAESGDTARAREHWERFLDRGGNHVLAGSVRVSLIGLDRAEGQSERVASELEAMLDVTPEARPLPGDLVLYELGKTYEALGRDEDAESVYQRLIEEYPRSAFVGEARTKLDPATGSLTTGFGA